MKKREADFGIMFRHWIKAHPMHTAAIELKQTTKEYIAFNCVDEDQLNYLSALSGDRGVLARTTGTKGMPDYIYGRNMPAYVFIKYPKGFVGITIGTFLLEKQRSKRQSLTYARAKDIAVIDVPR